jgi:type II secretory pathway component PulJ
MDHSQVRTRRRQGFSLFELVIYLGLLSIVSLIIGGTFISITRGRDQVQARNEVNSNLRSAVEKIGQDIRSASSVTTPASAGATSSTLTLSVSGTSITYCVINSQLRRQSGGNCTSASEAITSNLVLIGTPMFTRLENTNTILAKTVVSMAISLSANYNSSSSDWQFSATKHTTISLR